MSVVHDCWDWPGSISYKGYGRVGRHSYVHRLVAGWFWSIKNRDVHHLCGNRRCCNQWHLVPMERAEHAQTRTRDLCIHGHPLKMGSWGRKYCLTCLRERARRRAARS